MWAGHFDCVIKMKGEGVNLPSFDILILSGVTMSDSMINVFDLENYFDEILFTTNKVTLEISDRKSVSPERIYHSLLELDDAIAQAIMFSDPNLNFPMQIRIGLNNLIIVLDDTYVFLEKLYNQQAN